MEHEPFPFTVTGGVLGLLYVCLFEESADAHAAINMTEWSPNALILTVLETI